MFKFVKYVIVDALGTLATPNYTYQMIETWRHSLTASLTQLESWNSIPPVSLACFKSHNVKWFLPLCLLDLSVWSQTVTEWGSMSVTLWASILGNLLHCEPVYLEVCYSVSQHTWQYVTLWASILGRLLHCGTAYLAICYKVGQHTWQTVTGWGNIPVHLLQGEPTYLAICYKMTQHI